MKKVHLGKDSKEVKESTRQIYGEECCIQNSMDGSFPRPLKNLPEVSGCLAAFL
jgi:hypothetical protein